MLEMTRGNVLLDAMEFECVMCVLSTKEALTFLKNRGPHKKTPRRHPNNNNRLVQSN